MKNFVRFAQVLVLVGFSACTTLQRLDVSPDYIDPPQLREQYEKAFGLLAAKLPTVSAKRAPEKKILSQLVEFKKEKVRWAYYEKNQVVVKEDGLASSSFLVAINPLQDGLTEERMTLQIDSTGPLLWIVPAKVSPLFGASVLAHELSHLYDRDRNGPEKDRKELLDGEIRAYDREEAALEILTDGCWRPMQNKIWEDLGKPPAHEIIKEFESLNLDNVSAQLNSCLGTASLSKREEWMRLAAIRTILVFYTIRSLHLKPAQETAELRNAMNLIQFAKPFP
jgi:hypothetical protein